MKRYVYLLWLIVAIVGVDSCTKKNEPEPTPAVVGKWQLNRIRFSGYPAPFTTNNGDSPSSGFGIDGNLNIKADKTFTDTFNNGVRISDTNGNWEFTNNSLQLKYSDGSDDTYDLNTSLDPNQLVSSAISLTDSLRNPQTNAVQAVPFKIQFVYVKQ